MCAGAARTGKEISIMSSRDRKDMARRSLGMWASHSPDQPEDVFSPDYVNHQEPDVRGTVSAKNLDSWKALVAEFHQAFSKSSMRVLMQIAERDHVATRWEITATHTGDFMGAAPTWKDVTWTGIQIDRFKDGKIVESWVDWDKYRFLQGIGVVT
jgi:predicted ester cyclase